MSLRLAIEQIQKPTWWFEDSDSEFTDKWKHESGKVKKDVVLKHIRQAGRADCAQIRRATGYTTQSIRYVTAKLIEDGKIRKVGVSSNRVFWEVLK